jgi:hypothetical protein
VPGKTRRAEAQHGPPPNFSQALSKREIRDLVEFLAEGD